MKNKALLALAVISICSVSVDTNATVFSGVAIGGWSNVQATWTDPDDPYRDIWEIENQDNGGDASFEWGTVDGENNTTPYPNEFDFNGIGSDGSPYVAIDSESSSPFLIGVFDYYNGTVYNADGILGVDLNIDFTIQDSNGGYLDMVELTSEFDIVNTPNVDANGDFLAVDDIVHLDSSSVSKLFSYDDKWYEFSIVGFSSIDDPTVPVTDFSSPESSNAVAGLYAQINEVPVPEPSTIFLFGVGMIGMFGLRAKGRKEV